MFGRVVDVVMAAACVTIAAVMLSEWVDRSSGTELSPSEMISVGTRIPSLPGISFREAARTLVIVTQSSCQYCEKSAGFWRRLVIARDEKRSPLRILAVSGENVDTTRAFFAEHDVRADAFVSFVLPVRGTPTLILIDSTGVVRRNWMGLPPSTGAEDEVIRSVL
jgi:hypothetical protein